MKRTKSMKDVFLSFINGKQKDESPSSSNCNLSSQGDFNRKNVDCFRTDSLPKSFKNVHNRSATLPAKSSSRQSLNQRKNSFSKSKRQTNIDSYETTQQSKHKQSSSSLSRLESIKKLSSLRKKNNNSGCKNDLSLNHCVDRPGEPSKQSTGGSSGQPASSSEKLLTCLEKLEKMSVHLNYINDVTNKLGEIRTSVDSNYRLNENPKASLKQQFFGKRKKRKQSVETSSDDSYNSLSDSNKLDKNSIPHSTTASVLPGSASPDSPSYFSSSDDSSTAYCFQSASSGYCSENNRFDQPSYHPYCYTDSVPSMDPYAYSSYYGALPNQDVYNDFAYGSESSYSYGGSVASHEGYVDDRGWIYLPFTSHEEPVYHYNVMQDPYSKENVHSSLNEHGQVPSGLYTWGENLGNDKALSKNSDIKAFGSFRYRNGERTLVGSHPAKSGKRVRFSKTVEKKEKKNDKLEAQQETLKSEEKKEEKADQKASTNCPPQEECRSSLSQQPIYEFPSGHIEQSCMCFDCILARQSSQLQATGNFTYY